MSTKIEWADETWNPVRGCSLVSDGCRNCYAMKFAHRFSGEGQPYEGLTKNTNSGVKWTGDVRLVPGEFLKPTKWKKPRRIFVCSMSDLFHESLSFEQINYIWLYMQRAPQHTYQILTKRPHRVAEFLEWVHTNYLPVSSNIWIGTSVEDQKTANERIPHLLNFRTNGVRFLSCEPLLGPVNLEMVDQNKNFWLNNEFPECPSINWVIAGGESGHNARPMHPDWVRSLRDQCAAAGVPFFFKQWGEWLPIDHADDDQYWDSKKSMELKEGSVQQYTMLKVGKKHSGNFLDGRQHLQFPITFDLEKLDQIAKKLDQIAKDTRPDFNNMDLRFGKFFIPLLFLLSSCASYYNLFSVDSCGKIVRKYTGKNSNAVAVQFRDGRGNFYEIDFKYGDIANIQLGDSICLEKGKGVRP